MGLLLQVNHPHLTFSDGLPFSGSFYPKPLHLTKGKNKNKNKNKLLQTGEEKKFHSLIFQRCQTSRILMKSFQYDLLGLLKLKPMETPQVIQFCVLISAQFNWVKEMLPERHMCAISNLIKTRTQQPLATPRDAKEMISSLQRQRQTWVKLGPIPGLDIIQDVPCKVLSGH